MLANVIVILGSKLPAKSGLLDYTLVWLQGMIQRGGGA